MIGFLGLSHLGLVSAAAAAAKGFEVIAFDEDAALVERVSNGDLPIVEPGLSELLASAGERLRTAADARGLAGCDLLYAAVDVPTREDDTSDTSPVDRLLGIAAEVSPPGASIVILSQVEPGFTRARRPLVERNGRTLSYQVETLVFGRAVERALAPERFIVGCVDPAVPLPDPLARHLAAYECPVLPMRYESAELCKIAINAFLVSSISTTNTLAELCEVTGADWAEIAPALRLDRRIGQHAYLSPGLGIGGANLSRDLATIDRIARETGADAGLVEAWRAHAAHRLAWPLKVLHERVLTCVPEPRIAVWGLAYKEHTRSIRNSPGVALAAMLADAGLEVAVYDPEAEPVRIASPGFRRLTSALDACADADALVVTTPWPEFRSCDPVALGRALRGRLVVDPYGTLDPARCEAAGLTVARLGSSAPDDRC